MSNIDEHMSNPKGAGSAASVRNAGQEKVESVGTEALGYVSLVRCDKQATLRSSERAFDSFIRADVHLCSSSGEVVEHALCSFA